MKVVKTRNQIKKQKKGVKVLMTFLKRTKEGKYAPIEKGSLQYSRLKEQPDTSNEEQFFYGLS